MKIKGHHRSRSTRESSHYVEVASELKKINSVTEGESFREETFTTSCEVVDESKELLFKLINNICNWSIVRSFDFILSIELASELIHDSTLEEDHRKKLERALDDIKNQVSIGYKEEADKFREIFDQVSIEIVNGFNWTALALNCNDDLKDQKYHVMAFVLLYQLNRKVNKNLASLYPFITPCMALNSSLDLTNKDIISCKVNASSFYFVLDKDFFILATCDKSKFGFGIVKYALDKRLLDMKQVSIEPLLLEFDDKKQATRIILKFDDKLRLLTVQKHWLKSLMETKEEKSKLLESLLH